MTLACLALAACAGTNGTANANNGGAHISADILRFP
jgi:hypothetical protein